MAGEDILVESELLLLLDNSLRDSGNQIKDK